MNQRLTESPSWRALQAHYEEDKGHPTPYLCLTGEDVVRKLCPSAPHSRRTAAGLTKSMMKQILLLAVLSCASLAQQDADTIIQRSVAANGPTGRPHMNTITSNVTGKKVEEPRHQKSS